LGGMTAASSQDAIEPVGRRHDRAGPRLRMADGQVGPVMQRVDCITRKSVEQALLQHHAGATATFFRRLEDEMHRPVETPRACEMACGTEQHRGVAVVTATMMYTGMPTGVREVRLLGDRERVHVSTQTNVPLAAPITQRTDDAGASETFVNLHVEPAQLGGDDARRAPLLERKFRVRMQIAPQRNQLWHQIVDIGGVQRGLHDVWIIRRPGS
jgi:hypothetical protein